LHDELLKSSTATLYKAFQSASQLEYLQENPKKPTATAMPVEGSSSSSPTSAIPADTDISADHFNKEIDALNFHLKALKG
jgi:hypothetical protein